MSTMSLWEPCTVRCRDLCLRKNNSEHSAYLEHDIDRAIIIDFDLHHGGSISLISSKDLNSGSSGNGTQALVMPLNEASHAEDLAVKAGKPPSGPMGKDRRRRRGWKGFYGSVHDIVRPPAFQRIALG